MGASALPRWLTGLLLLLLCTGATAENSQDFGQYVVHFNALSTDQLPPTVTREYGITRSRNRGMLNIAVLKKVMGTTGTPVSADVGASATNLTGRKSDIKLREIREATAIYYIGEFGITNEETLDFEVVIQRCQAGPGRVLQRQLGKPRQEAQPEQQPAKQQHDQARARGEKNGQKARLQEQPVPLEGQELLSGVIQRQIERKSERQGRPGESIEDDEQRGNAARQRRAGQCSADGIICPRAGQDRCRW